MSPLLMLPIGLVLGAVVTVWLLGRWADSRAGARQLALYQAEQRIKDVQAASLMALADVAERAVHAHMGVPDVVSWPSDRPGRYETVALSDETIAEPSRRSRAWSVSWHRVPSPDPSVPGMAAEVIDGEIVEEGP